MLSRMIPMLAKIGMILPGIYMILKVPLESYMSSSSTDILMNFFAS